jgi:peptidyl-prolyl cis-trans isomerase A (cyclophilin A)
MTRARRTLLLLTACAATGLAGCAGGSAGCGGDPPPSELPPDHVLLDPAAPAMRVVPPDSFDVLLETTKGDVVIRVIRDWAPLGAYRVYNLARNGFYDGSYFYRVLPGFAAQFGMSGRPAVDQVWHEQTMPDDPRRESNAAGTVAFAKAGPDSRTTQLFISYSHNEGLDRQDFVPIGRVVDGMGVLFTLYSGYGETQPQGTGPAFHCILSHGNQYLARRYPRLDRIERAVVIDGTDASF